MRGRLIPGASDRRRLTKVGYWEKILETQQSIASSFLKSGPVAQLGARFHGMEEVVGSIPTRSTKIVSLKINNLTSRPPPLCNCSVFW